MQAEKNERALAVDGGADRPREYCGLMGIYGPSGAAWPCYMGLFSLQHRGQEGAGIVAGDGEELRTIKGLGVLTQVFAQRSLDELPGHVSIGHVRYSTTGSSRPYNVQPLVVGCVDGLWAIAHNGNLINARALRRAYQEAGALFQTSTDSEILIHLIADPLFRNRPRRVERALAELRGAFAFLLMTPDRLMAVRDPHGFRPLSLGKLPDGGYAVASETCALTQIGAEFVRDIRPGELLTIDAQGLHSAQFAEPGDPLGQCIFEQVYFARPDSMVFGEPVHDVRLRLGRFLAQEHPVQADVVIPVPDSGNFAALGYSRASGIPYDYGFIRNHYIGRTFIMPESAERASGVDLKLAVVRDVVHGKRVIVVDDSIVRGNTCQRRVQALRAAGAREIHLRISCPPVRHPCYFGIDFPSRDDLVAAHHDAAEIGRMVGADSLAYLSMEGLLASVGQPERYCTGCYQGTYPMAVPEPPRKQDMEERNR